MVLDIIAITLAVMFLLFFTVGIILFVVAVAIKDLLIEVHSQTRSVLRHINGLKDYEGSEPV